MRLTRLKVRVYSLSENMSCMLWNFHFSFSSKTVAKMESTFILVKVITILWSLLKQYLRDSLETLTKQGVQQVGVSLQKTEMWISSFWNNEEILSIIWKSSKKELDLFQKQTNKKNNAYTQILNIRKQKWGGTDLYICYVENNINQKPKLDFKT